MAVMPSIQCFRLAHATFLMTHKKCNDDNIVPKKSHLGVTGLL